MKNPIDILGVHPTGALPRRPDPRDYPFLPGEVAQAGIPFDWNTGYDVEEDVSKELGTPFVLPTKDQGTSGSCGGQAFSYYDQVLAAFYSHSTIERSAKYPYSQVYVGNVASGGGSYDRDLANIGIKQGFGSEALTRSYPLSGPTTEAFMERPQDITAAARLTAAGEKIISAYAFPKLDIDSFAQAIQGAKGSVAGLHGTNNGTWLSSDPKPPQPGDPLWAHYMYGGKAKIRNGRKSIAFKQSWGSQAAPDTNGWQWLNEDHFRGLKPAIWSGISMVYNPIITTPPKYTFNTDLKLGQSGPDVLALQQMLAYDGEFTLAPTGYYGTVTAQAVLKFQVKYSVASLATIASLMGGSVGPATRAKLNSLT